MDELQVGERIAALDSRGDVVYSEVIEFLDRQPSEKRQFIRISTESGRTLTLTPAHLVPVEGKSSIFAATIQVGDRVLVRDSDEMSENKAEERLRYDRVLEAKLVLEEGVFAPLTTEGTLLVDDVVASCYAVVDSQTIAHYAFLPLRLWKSLTSGVSRFSRFLKESVTREPEVRSVITEQQDSNSLQQSEGVLWYASMLYSVAAYVLPAKMLY